MLGAIKLGHTLLGGKVIAAASGSPITISSPLAAETIANEVYIQGTTDTSATVEYRIDSGSWGTLATPSGGTYSGLVTGLVAGSHTIEVRQSDVPSNTDSVSVTVVNSSVDITSPAPYSLKRRGDSTTASINVTFTFTGVHTSGWEVRFNRDGTQAWQSFSQGSTPRTVTLTGEAKGVGTIEVRSVTNVNATDSVTPVAVGRAIACLGQSNSSGRGTNNQSAPANSAYLYDNTGTFRALADPYDGNFGGSATYSVLDDSTSATGSPYPLLATSLVGAGEPVLFIPCNKGSTSIGSWARNLATSSLYGASKARIDAAGGCDLIIWHQGEADVVAGTSEATYTSALTQLVNDFRSDFSNCNVGIVKLNYDGGVPANLTNIRNAQEAVITGVSGAYLIADVAPFTGLHLTTNGELSDFADKLYTGYQSIYSGAYAMAVTAGSYAITGNNVTLTGPSAFSVAVTTGSYLITGVGPRLRYSGEVIASGSRQVKVGFGFIGRR